LPYDQRQISTEYRDLLKYIRDHGIRTPVKQGGFAYAVMGLTMRFPVAHGAPIITERDMSKIAPGAIGEICAFINGARSLDEFKAFGCTWWGSWATAEKCLSRGLDPGDLGPGSYGHAFRHFTTSDDPTEGGFDQLPHLIQKLRDLPDDKTAEMSPWIPQFNHREKGVKSRNTIAPCHGWVHAVVLNGGLHVVHRQRSGDTPIGVPSNMAQYAALALMLEHLTGYPLVEFVHFISYAHIFESQLEYVEEMLNRDPRPLPTLALTDEGKQITDIHHFRKEHFKISDYDPHPSIRDIPVLV
jgi:thymidylate synthase